MKSGRFLGGGSVSVIKGSRAGPGTGSMGGKCSVCGDRATKFRYSLYSTTSCFSCRAFFRRSLVGGKFETFTCRSLHGAGSGVGCTITATNRKKCQACRFSKCRAMGMTHTTMGQKMGPLGHLTSSKSSSVSSLPSSLDHSDEVTGYFYSTGDLFDPSQLPVYDYPDLNIQPLSCPPIIDTDLLYTTTPTDPASYSYTIIPASETEYQVDTFPLYPTETQTLEQTDHRSLYPTDQLDTDLSGLYTDQTECIPTIRLLYADPLDPQQSLLDQLYTADNQSTLCWSDVSRITGDPSYEQCVVQVGEQAAGSILMEEQVTESVFHLTTIIVWEKIVKFVQNVPELYQLTKGELDFLLDMNRNHLLMFNLSLIFNKNFSSLQDQMECLKVFRSTDLQSGGSFSLAPSVTPNLFSRVFSQIFPDYKRAEIEETLLRPEEQPHDRTVSCLIILLIFTDPEVVQERLHTNTTYGYEENILEDLGSRLRTIYQRLETCLKTYFTNHYGGFVEMYQQCRVKIENSKEIAKTYQNSNLEMLITNKII